MKDVNIEYAKVFGKNSNHLPLNVKTQLLSWYDKLPKEQKNIVIK